MLMWLRPDGSVLLVWTTPNKVAEKDSSLNLGIGGFHVIDTVKSKFEAGAPGWSRARTLWPSPLADGVGTTGGKYYSIPSGRRDCRVSLAADAANNLSGSFFNVVQLKENFATKGLSLEEMVTL
ncbi:hypothetical protein SAY86_004772 [Trapa natans]|uniref:peroxidase n=1 Tax=Trapa natans TaxID=22666 RepID=A0AAN7MZ62_TRANT|nr:hypothetical protein SAY86_004772 [Trapa natans]